MGVDTLLTKRSNFLPKLGIFQIIVIIARVERGGNAHKRLWSAEEKPSGATPSYPLSDLSESIVLGNSIVSV